MTLHKIMKHLLSLILAALTLVVVPGPASRIVAQTAPVDLRILAINDFHGNLRPPAGGIRITDPDDKTKKIVVPAGGGEHLAALGREIREGKNHTPFGGG